MSNIDVSEVLSNIKNLVEKKKGAATTPPQRTTIDNVNLSKQNVNKDKKGNASSKKEQRPPLFIYSATHLQVNVAFGENKTSILNVCPIFEILGLARDTNNENWGLALRWNDLDGYVHTGIICLGDFHKRYKSEIVSNLVNNGFQICANMGNYLISYLETRSPHNKLRTISKIGWTPDMDAFALPDTIFGKQGEYLFHGHKEHPYKTHGILKEWQNVAKLAEGNSRIAFAISMAFLPPLLEIIGHDGFGINFYGESKSGKTTLQYIAGSVWGGKKYFTTWRTTANGIEGLAADRNCTFMGLDELHLIAPDDFDKISYFLAEGCGKNRAQQNGDAKKPKIWSIAYLSTGEISSKQKLAEGGIKQQAGQKMRIIDVPAKPKNSHGVYECLHDFLSVAEISQYLKQKSQECYGTAIRAYLGVLITKDHHAIKEQYDIFLKDFIKMFDHLYNIKSDQIKHIARCLASIGFAGFLATQWGILPWQAQTSKEAAVKIFMDWLSEHESDSDSFEEDEILNHLCTQLQVYGASHFLDYEDRLRDVFVKEVLGYVRIEGGQKISIVDGGSQKFIEGGTRFFLITFNGFKEIFKNFNQQYVLDVLKKRNILVSYQDVKTGVLRPSHSLKPRGTKIRLYKISEQRLFDEVDRVADEIPDDHAHSV